MIGFGNPLLDGKAGDGNQAAAAKRARATQRCPEPSNDRVASLTGQRTVGLEPIATRGGLADVVHIKHQAPLPETADELCAVARDLHADVREMRLGSRATEHEIKAMSDSGVLAKYKIVHFATHGTLAGQLRGTTEPGLILTPPDKATEDDDGYLSASEIAGLKLDADWVILSACNTAAPGTNGAEALSGLARAFFFAQARALLVSHWEVNSDATVKLITTAVGELARDKSIGRAEALRRAMLALMTNKDRPWASHPAFWPRSWSLARAALGGRCTPCRTPRLPSRLHMIWGRMGRGGIVVEWRHGWCGQGGGRGAGAARAAAALGPEFGIAPVSAAEPAPVAAAKQPGMLGVQMRDLTKEEADKLGFDAPTGVWIDKVNDGTPAQTAGLQAGDVILIVDGVEIEGATKFREAMGAKGAGAQVKFRLMRQGRMSTLTATLAARPWSWW